MALVVVLILVALWIAVLTPGIVKRRRQRQASGSIETFHRQLYLLERAGPKIVPPAYRLETARSGSGLAPGQSGYPAVSSMPGRPNLVLLEPVHTTGAGEEPEVVDPATGAQYRRAPVPEPPVTPARRQVRDVPSMAPLARLNRDQARRRRQDILFGLAGTVVVTALVGVVPKLHALWIGTGLAAAALVCFLGLVALAQRWAAEAGIRRPSRPYAADPRLDAHPGYWGEPYADEEPAWAVAAGR